MSPDHSRARQALPLLFALALASVALGALVALPDREHPHAQFAHVWKLRGGKVVSFQQYTDTLQATKAVSG